MALTVGVTSHEREDDYVQLTGKDKECNSCGLNQGIIREGLVRIISS
jgi:hypothetical protein